MYLNNKNNDGWYTHLHEFQFFEANTRLVALKCTLSQWYRVNLTDNLTLQVLGLIFFYSTSLSCDLISLTMYKCAYCDA
jgi:hypothetical protein